MLEAIKSFCESKVSLIKLPTSVQKDDTENEDRAPEVHIMRLPESGSAKKYAPYIIVQFVNRMEKTPIQHHWCV